MQSPRLQWRYRSGFPPDSLFSARPRRNSDGTGAKEALNKSARMLGGEFFFKPRFGKCRNTGCISNFPNRRIGGKDLSSTAALFIQRFPKYSFESILYTSPKKVNRSARIYAVDRGCSTLLCCNNESFTFSMKAGGAFLHRRQYAVGHGDSAA